MQKITPFLWFDKEAREAARFYVEVFGEGSRIIGTDTMEDTPSGAVDIVNVELRGQEFTLMSAGPYFKFTEAISFVIDCANQAEVDYFWEKLTGNGGQESQCGWLKDQFGVSWQVVPRRLHELLTSPEKDKASRATQAMLQMKKIDLQAVEDAFEGRA